MIAVKDEDLLVIYVDKIPVMSTTKQALEGFRDLLKPEFKIKQLGTPKHILRVHRSHSFFQNIQKMRVVPHFTKETRSKSQ
jgi:hypothetical protein